MHTRKDPVKLIRHIGQVIDTFDLSRPSMFWFQGQSQGVWAVAGFVALVAGIAWGARLGVQFSLSLIALKALPVLILGGFTSVPGAIIGGSA